MAPQTTHHAAMLHIFRYVKRILFHGLHYSFYSSLELRAYSNANWAGDPIDQMSTTGYYFFLSHSFISWRRKNKQTVVVQSSTKVQYQALTDTA